MSVNSKIIAAVKEIAPCYPWEVYEGSSDVKLDEYLVFNYETIPVAFGDGNAHYERYLIQLHYFGPLMKNTVKLRKMLKRAIAEAGFTFPEETNASDKEGQHYVFEFEDVESTEVEDDS